MSDDILKRVQECITRHNKTGYSGVLKWVELEEVKKEILRLRDENERLRTQLDEYAKLQDLLEEILVMADGDTARSR